MTQEDIDQAYDYHHEFMSWGMRSANSPIAYALSRLGHDDLSVGYTDVCRRSLRETENGSYYVGTFVVELPEEAKAWMMRFGHSLGGKETRRSYEARKALRKTSSDHKTKVKPGKQGGMVKPFEFELGLDE